MCNDAERFVRAVPMKGCVPLLGVVGSHGRTLSAAVAPSDVSFNAVARALTCSILSLSPSQPCWKAVFHSNIPKTFHGRQSPVAGEQAVDLLAPLFRGMRRSRGKGAFPSACPREKRPQEGAVGTEGRVAYHSGPSCSYSRSTQHSLRFASRERSK